MNHARAPRTAAFAALATACTATVPEGAVDAASDGQREAAADVAVDTAEAPPARRFLVDSQGRALILHGANVGSKDPPDHVPAITQDEVRRMAQEWGFNFVRYLIFWDAIEPTAGAINGAYLDAVASRLDEFAAQGIYVMLDMHQDVYARRFCCDGAPEWAIRDDGQAFMLQPTWSFNYFQPAVQRAFDNFWSYAEPNRDLQEHYIAAWVAVATRFRTHPAVIGYDFMNEPSPGSMFVASEALIGVGAGAGSLSARFDQTRLGPFYQRLIDAVRAVDRDRYLFIEPRFGGAGAGAVQYLPTLVDRRAGEGRVVFAPHLYSVPYEARMMYDTASDRTVARWEAARVEETRSHDWPIVMGEFGMDQTFPGAARYLDDVLDMADRMMIPWAYWAWSPGTWGFWDPATRTERPNINQLVRVYPQRVAGTPTSWSWDRAARVFTLTFASSPGATGATELFVPTARFYSDGYALTVSDPPDTWSQSWDATRQVLSVTTRASTTAHTITLRPR